MHFVRQDNFWLLLAFLLRLRSDSVLYDILLCFCTFQLGDARTWLTDPWHPPMCANVAVRNNVSRSNERYHPFPTRTEVTVCR